MRYKIKEKKPLPDLTKQHEWFAWFPVKAFDPSTCRYWWIWREVVLRKKIYTEAGCISGSIWIYEMRDHENPYPGMEKC